MMQALLRSVTSLREGQRPSLLATLIILTMSVIGFTAQLAQVSMQYFAYRTTTQVTLSTPEAIKFHTISLCIRYSDILDTESVQRDTGIVWNRNWSDWQVAFDMESLLTVDQIFKYTPSHRSILRECMYRADNWTFVMENRGHVCERLFQIRRYFTQEYMCYSFERTNDALISVLSVTRSTFAQFLMYELFLDHRFDHVNRINVASFDGDIPYFSRDFSASFYLDSLGNRNYIEVISADYQIDLLPAPYDTRCTRCYNQQQCDRHRCFPDCLIRRHATLNRVPAATIVLSPINMTVMSRIDLMNKTILNMVRDIFFACERSCAYTACRTQYSKTTAWTQEYGNGSFGFASLTPIEPSIQTSAQPTMTGIDYFSFVCACIGTWFGLSCLSISRGLRRLMHQRQQNRIRRRRQQQHQHGSTGTVAAGDNRSGSGITAACRCDCMSGGHDRPAPAIIVNVLDVDARIKRTLRIK